MNGSIKRVVVADDHALFLDGITSLLNSAGFEVIGQAGNGKQLLKIVRQLEPDLVLLDVEMPEMNGLEALEIIKIEFPLMKTVILTVSSDEVNLYRAIRNGADGYLLKDVGSEEFLSMLRGLERGEPALSPVMTSKLMAGFQEISSRGSISKNDLTEREVELLGLMGEGSSNKDIAKQLFISENTVKFHIRNILQKLGVQNRTEAVATAIHQKLIHKKG